MIIMNRPLGYSILFHTFAFVKISEKYFVVNVKELNQRKLEMSTPDKK
jgi:hypothetical protein